MVIYKTTNSVNGKFYIGKDTANNPNYLGSGLTLKRAIKKYGKDKFNKEVIEFCQNFDDLNAREKYWISKLNSTNRKIGYNIAEGGTGGDTMSSLSKRRKAEISKKMSISSKRAYTKERREKSRDRSLKMWENLEHKERIRKIMLGRKCNWGKKISKAVKKYYSENPVSEERRAQMSKYVTGRYLGEKSPCFIKVRDLETKEKISKLYETMGPNLIEKELKKHGIKISRYVIVRTLKEMGIYKKYQKGIGQTRKKRCSLTRIGEKNPYYQHGKSKKYK